MSGWKCVALTSAAAAMLLGCPSSPYMRVQAISGERPIVQVLDLDQATTPIPRERQRVVDARVECEGCAHPPVAEGRGAFWLSVEPTSNAPPKLKVTAPGYKPATFTLDEAPDITEGGTVVLVVGLEPEKP